MSSSRTGFASRRSSPSTPWPSGGGPIAASVSGSMPWVTNRSRREPLGSTTPSAAYRAPVIPAASASSRFEQRVEAPLGRERDPGLDERAETAVELGRPHRASVNQSATLRRRPRPGPRALGTPSP